MGLKIRMVFVTLESNIGTFAINFLAFEQANFIQQAGVFPGSNVNKFKQGKVDFDKSRTTNAPILHDEYIAYECKVMNRILMAIIIGL
ncbi:flavin reductase family protein [Halalkalibacter alkalisediminis]|uniref:Flavin reductase n=1 Tax=Halalkalibacter alkalisediminis TaxID=935616 RepID=A0ABV6NJ61_9BACI|nr:flavin reductase family protein [Halalkalibacter alkalisediminis]